MVSIRIGPHAKGTKGRSVVSGHESRFGREPRRVARFKWCQGPDPHGVGVSCNRFAFDKRIAEALGGGIYNEFVRAAYMKADKPCDRKPEW